ncbi:MAG: hypothetical protein P9L96_06705 [Candidatus Gygaella obscura]|nr:hypothetical protein [Candidatus Gygaella obscura]
MPFKRQSIYKKQLLGQIFLKSGIISKEQLKEALETQKKEGGFLGSVLIKLGYLTEMDLVTGLSSQCSIPYLPPQRYKIPKSVSEIMTEDFLRENSFVPIDKFHDTLTVCMVNPLNDRAISEISRVSNMEVLACIATKEEIEKTINSLFKKNSKNGL